jgi:hypothetical protein
MARTKKQQSNGSTADNASGGKGETIAGYFRKIFAENPKYLKGRSNAELLRRWQEDHPDQPVTDSVKNSLANLKSVLRKKGRKRRGKRTAEETAGTAMAMPAVAAESQPGADLERLELAIDDCITLARELDVDRLDDVINSLRRARREVVWLMGE